MKCPICEKLGLSSTVQRIASATSPPALCIGIRTIDGEQHHHNWKHVWTHYRCSNRHDWIESIASVCPVEDCSWNDPNRKPHLQFNVINSNE